jgi:hypothetical protein
VKGRFRPKAATPECPINCQVVAFLNDSYSHSYLLH